jgi:hypothetical protein
MILMFTALNKQTESEIINRFVGIILLVQLFLNIYCPLFSNDSNTSSRRLLDWSGFTEVSSLAVSRRTGTEPTFTAVSPVQHCR